MNSDDELCFSADEYHVPELVQCEVPKEAAGLGESMDTWFQRSSVGRNVKLLEEVLNAEPKPPPPAAKPVEVPTGVQEKENGKIEPPPRKGRARKAASIPSTERNAKKLASSSSSSSSSSSAASSSCPCSSVSTSLSSPMTPLPCESLPPFPPSSSPIVSEEISVPADCDLSDEQVHVLVQKALSLELLQLGFHSSEGRALAVFGEVAVRYMSKLARNLRIFLDRYSSLSVDPTVLWYAWFRSMHISLPELPLFAHEVVNVRHRALAVSSCEGDKVPHEHTALASLVQDNKQVLEAFQHDHPIRLSRQRMQPVSPPQHDYGAYFDTAAVGVDTSTSNFNPYSLDSFPAHMPLPDPIDPSFSYPSAYPYYGSSSPSAFDPEKQANFYSYANSISAAGSASPSMVPFPVPQRDSRS